MLDMRFCQNIDSGFLLLDHALILLYISSFVAPMKLHLVAFKVG